MYHDYMRISVANPCFSPKPRPLRHPRYLSTTYCSSTYDDLFQGREGIFPLEYIALPCIEKGDEEVPFLKQHNA